MITLGQKIDNFTLKDDQNNDISLYDIKNDYIILYFYPKDNTKGCTIEALLYKDYFDKFKELNTTIIGISKDDIESHCKFKNNYDLPFMLLSDPNMDVINRFGAYGEKNLYGKKSFGIIRKTFILSKNYEVIKIYEKAIAKDNASRVYNFILEKEGK
ncbi:MAG: peroxiredoxin [Bacilli bacterium]|nr:peroxiredoxin [Bacilli bacterium]